MAKTPREITNDRGTNRVIFLLSNEQVGYLDHVTADIRSKSGTVIKRTEVVRGIVEALRKQKLDFSGATSEAEIAAILAKKLK